MIFNSKNNRKLKNCWKKGRKLNKFKSRLKKKKLKKNKLYNKKKQIKKN